LGYGNAQFGANLPRRRMDTKGEVVYFVEANGNDPWHIGFGSWYYTKYRHGQGKVANVLRVDGHVRDVRDPITDAFLPGGGLRWTN
jgi:prepilin-type processing-associated H-X9-DG protein